MKKYIKTTSFTYYFEEHYKNEESKSRKYKEGTWDRYYWNVKKGSVEKGMKELSDFCNKHGFQIMGVLPILRAQAFDQAYTFDSYTWKTTGQGGGWGAGWGGGLGLGWGITMTDGFTAMLQSIEELTDDDYEKRIAEDQRLAGLKREYEANVKSLEANITKLKSENESIKKQCPAVEATYKEKLTLIEGVKSALDSGIEEKKKGMLSKKIVYRFDSKGFETRAEAEELESFTREELKKMEAEAEAVNLRVKKLHQSVKDNEASIISSNAEVNKLGKELAKLQF